MTGSGLSGSADAVGFGGGCTMGAVVAGGAASVTAGPADGAGVGAAVVVGAGAGAGGSSLRRTRASVTAATPNATVATSAVTVARRRCRREGSGGSAGG